MRPEAMTERQAMRMELDSLREENRRLRTENEWLRTAAMRVVAHHEKGTLGFPRDSASINALNALLTG